MQTKGALEGITVVDLSRLLPGPYCSMILADHGARVIAVEDKRFEADDLFMPQLYRNKEHMSLNLKSKQGLEVFFKLMETADVVLEGFRPGVVTKLGVDSQEVVKVNPGIIYCSITGYGQTGPYQDRAGHDVNYLAQAGVLDLIGEPDRPPSIPGVQIADIMGGGQNAALGILLALFDRQRTGQGQYIDISMSDGSLSLLPLMQFIQEKSGQEPRRGQHLLSHRYACYNTYETRDGRSMALGAVEHRFWKNLCLHLNCPEYIPQQYSEERRLEIIDFFRQRFREKTLKQWEEELKGVDCCCEPVRTMAEALAHPLFRERDMVVPIEGQSKGSLQALGVPVKLSRTPGRLRSPAVCFGQNTGAVLQELGYSQMEIERMSQDGVW
ncbi:MAG: CoA transferase [Desulfohalobiaceae bacterium]|nr:CoA transferase [Desulfohalobiaceae bacterium]